MKQHPIPQFIPPELGLGAKTKLTIAGRPSTPVPPTDGKAYRKNPRNDNDTRERRRDAYFVGQLISIYQGREFERGNLDAGRLNRLWCDDILIICSPDAATNPYSKYRLDLGKAEELLQAMRQA